MLCYIVNGVIRAKRLVVAYWKKGMEEIIKHYEPPLRVLTFNIWGLPFSDHRGFRIHSIAKTLSALSLDIIGLQEAWLPRDRAVIAGCLARSGVRYAHYDRSGLFGSGLFLLSRYPIIAANFHRFSLGGMPEKISADGEYLSGKGIAFARIQSPFGLLDVYNTQLIAQYKPDEKDEYQAYRAVALFEAAQFINATSAGNPVIALGDFNIQPDQFEYQLLAGLAGLGDGCAMLAEPTGPGETFSPENPFTRGAARQRLDYIFIRGGSAASLRPLSGSTTLKQIPGTGEWKTPLFYSDHYAVQMDIRVDPFEPRDTPPGLSHASVESAPAGSRELFVVFRAILEEAAISARNKGRRHLKKALSGFVFAALSRDARGQDPRRAPRVKYILFAARVLAALYAAVQLWLSLRVTDREEKFLCGLLEEVDRKICEEEETPILHPA